MLVGIITVTLIVFFLLFICLWQRDVLGEQWEKQHNDEAKIFNMEEKMKDYDEVKRYHDFYRKEYRALEEKLNHIEKFSGEYVIVTFKKEFD